jgi:3-isopropylmalate/(R)-2-methylmalate dehydratase small subunit
MSSARVEVVAGSVLVLDVDDVDTDQIIPGRHLTAIDFTGLENVVFENDRTLWRAEGRVHPFDDPAKRDAKVLLSGQNFGCGSSREHAARGLAQRGIGAIVAESFGEIFAQNCANLGVACVRVSGADRRRLVAAAAANNECTGVVDLRAMTVTLAGVRAPCRMPEHRRRDLLEGRWDPLTVLLEGAALVDQRLGVIRQLR